MSVVVDSPETNSWPLKVRAKKPPAGGAVRTIRVGILGLGQVGQAVARLAADRSATAHAGLRFQVEHALVRDIDKPRRCPRPPRITADASAFLRGNYDLVVEALDTIEPARTIVARLLGRGTSVVTANKALVAEHRDDLASIAASRSAAFRYEATALAAVPFLGTLAARPLVASVDRVVAIVNGTSNFILTALAAGTSFDQALSRAQALGYAEPDASRDLNGVDAADKLLLLTSLFGWGKISRDALDVTGIRAVTAEDLTAARSIGGTIKAVVAAERDANGVTAFVGPVFVPLTDPLASLGGALNGVRLDGRHVSNLFFSGPGAGPDVTAATLLDDAIEAFNSKVRLKPNASQKTRQNIFASSPATSWLLRVRCPGVLPPASAIQTLVCASGLPVERVADHATADTRWVLIGPQSRRNIDAAIAKLASTHRIDAAAFRRL